MCFVIMVMAVVGVIIQSTGLNIVIQEAGLADEFQWFVVAAAGAILWYFLIKVSKGN